MRRLFDETLNNIIINFLNTLEENHTRNDKDKAIFTAKEQMIGAYKFLKSVAAQQIVERCEQDLKENIKELYDAVGWNYDPDYDIDLQ